MNNTQMTARVGLFFILGMALIWVVFESLSNGPLFREKGYTVVAAFDDLKQLKEGDEVRIAGVKVGSVLRTELAGRQAQAVLEIRKGVAIADDSTAGVAMAGLLGTNYVAIDLGQSRTILAEGGRIATKDTADLNSIMAQLGNLGDELKGALSGFSQGLNGGPDGGGLFQKLDKLVANNSENLTRTISNLEAITTEIKSGRGTLGRLVNDPQLHDELVATIAEIRRAAAEAQTFVADARSVVAQVKSGKGTVGALLYDDATAENLRITIANLREISFKLNQGQGTIGKLLSDDSLYREAQGVIRKADRALGSMEDQGPITAVGVAANALF